MKTLLYFLLIFVFLKESEAQTFQVGHLQKTFVDLSRSNRQIPCEIYYPSTATGNNTPVANGHFPVLVFGHGFVMTWSAYNIYWLTLVPKGYIIVFPTTESSFSPSHSNFGKDLAFLCGAMKNEGNNVNSPFYGSVDSTCAVMGHSMGGGCAFLALQFDTTITAIATVAAAVTNPSSVTAALSIIKPSIVFAGSNDCVAPPSNHQIPMYDSLASVCKSFISITGGNHCQFASYNFNCSIGQSTCMPQATINDTTQQNLVFAYLLPWLNFYLKNDCNSGNQFQNLITTANSITAQQNCTLFCNATSTNEINNFSGFNLFPNPCVEYLTFESSGCIKDNQYSIIDLLGKEKIAGFTNSIKTTIDITSLPNGIYVFSENGRVKSKFIKVKL